MEHFGEVVPFRLVPAFVYQQLELLLQLFAATPRRAQRFSSKAVPRALGLSIWPARSFFSSVFSP